MDVFLWSIIYSLDPSKYYRYGKIKNPCVKRNLIADLFEKSGKSRKYSYQVCKRLRENSPFFTNNENEEDLLRCRSLEEVCEYFSINIKKARRYVIVECNFGFTSFKHAVINILSSYTKSQKETAKYSGLTRQTIGTISKKVKNNFKQITEGHWETMKDLTYVDLDRMQYDHDYEDKIKDINSKFESNYFQLLPSNNN